ncbi:MAG: methylated-DNA--[protein]-cysteine S-methyltransferase [Phascolarctobacterium sp.]|nr:methylated-DNA--[protein]-cysteine S-methyltransferase [Phascolarctobacterium sp.]
MQYTTHYTSPLGELILACDDIGLVGLWFAGQKYEAAGLKDAHTQEHLILEQTKNWLDIYFTGKEPDFFPPLHASGSDFRKEVWEILCTIPYGATITYGDIAQQIAQKQGRKRMSAQAVGGAVGHNPIGIIVPCHRVVGTNGSLTGYAGGIQRKLALLKLEGIDVSKFTIPTKGTAI